MCNSSTFRYKFNFMGGFSAFKVQVCDYQLSCSEPMRLSPKIEFDWENEYFLMY